MSDHLKARLFARLEPLEQRRLLSSDIQIVPLHGAYCHCVGCAAPTDRQNDTADLGLVPASLQASAIIKLGVFNPPPVTGPVYATVIQLLTREDFSPAAPAFSAKIDFKPASASTFSGYLADTGKTYGDRGNGRTYGWKSDNSSSHYDRNSSQSPDQRYDTTALMSSSDVWEMKVPKGWYDVDVYVGDANKGGADLRINVEGKLTAWVQLHYPEKRFGEGHIKLYVSDGKLSVSTGSGAKNNSIAFLHINSTSAPPGVAKADDLRWSASSSIASPIKRVESGVVRIGDKMYFIGGYTNGYNSVSNRVDIFDLKTNKWSRGANLPGAQTHAGAATDGRYIYWAGGQYGSLYSRKGTNEVWRFDTKYNKWERYENLPEVRFGGGLAYQEGKLYFFGGALSDRNTASAKAWKLDTKSSNPHWDRIADMPRAADHIGHAELDGLIYAIGGEHDHGNSYIQHNDVFAYNPKTNSWARKANMPTASSHFEGNVIEHDDKLWIFGGQIDAQLLTAQVRSYDPKTNKWTLHNSMPEQRKGGGGWFYNNKFYYLTGDTWGKGQRTNVLIASFK